MSDAVLDIKVLSFVLGVVAQAAITWWRVETMDRDIREMKHQLHDLHGLKARSDQEHEDFSRRIATLEGRVFNGWREQR